MFCFRWRDLIVTDDGVPPTDEEVLATEDDFTWHGGIQSILHQNIISKLNPLKICAPTIVAQFARMAHHLKFLYVYSKLETNKRVRLARSIGGGGAGYMDGMAARETALSMKHKGGDEGFLLDAYFPFDPYVLPQSRRWIVSDYVEWRPVPGMRRREGDEEDEDEDDDDDSEEEEGDSEEEDDESSGSEVGDEEDEGDVDAAEVESTDLSA